jgi:hypothetical protein
MPSIIHSQTADIPYNMTTTGFDVPGFRIVDNLGVVRGVVVRSRSVFGTVGASLQTLLGGNISLSKHVDLKLVSRLEFGSGAVAMRYEPRR